MHAPFQIRALAPSDSIEKLTELLHAAYAQLAALGFNYTAVDQTEEVTRRRILGGECYVACDDNEIIGTIMFYPRARGGCAWLERPDVAGVGQLGILPSWQRRGIGTALMAWSEKRARSIGATEIALDTSEGATHLIRWYTALGYRQVDIVQWNGKTYRSLILSKTLGG